jgi:replicative DNA helicase
MADPHLLDPILLRGVIDCSGDPQPALLQNLMALRAEVRPEGLDLHLLTFLGGLADQTGVVPSLALLSQHYTHLQMQGDPHGFSGLTRIMEAVSEPLLQPVDYQYALTTYRERVLGDGLGMVLQAAATILTTGHHIQPPKGPPITLKGPQQAIQFVTDSVETLSARFQGGAVEGNLRDEIGRVWERYQQRLTQPPKLVRTGFEQIDTVHGGIRPGDLALVLGFTGQYKSLVVLNIGYRALLAGKSVAFVPLEGSAIGIMDSLAVLHCQHPKFGDHLLRISYDRLQQGTLTPAELDLLQTALADLRACGDYGTLLYKEPDRADITMGEIRRWAEGKARTVPLDLLAIDYLGLVNPSSGGLSMRESAFANQAIREAKQTAMSFNRGHGIGIISPFQSNRDGFKEAEKVGGRYSLRALAWAPEAERSSDLVYSVYRDESMARDDAAVLGNLKARDRALILDTWRVTAEPATRYIGDLKQRTF